MYHGRNSPLNAVPTVLTTGDLRQAGLTKRQIAAAVVAGSLVRVRLGRYLPAQTAPELIDAAVLGGRVDCVSLLRLLGVFVQHASGLHVRFPPHATRIPSHPSSLRRHWLPSVAPANAVVVDTVEALVQAVRCQPPRAAVATLDSAWNLGVADEAAIDEVFRQLPRRFQVLRGLLDHRAESGTESLTRLLLRTLGCRIDVQVRIAGVGRVDFVVDGWLIVECDSRQFHSTWESHASDRRRDAAALEHGFVTVRLLAVDILSRPDAVREQLGRIIDRGPGGPRSGRPGHSVPGGGRVRGVHRVSPEPGT